MLDDNVNVLPKLRDYDDAKTSKKKVLLLGSGLVAPPAADYITKHKHELTIACRTFETAEALAAKFPNATPMSVDVSSADALRQAIKGHDVVVSLVPYTHHATVMQIALEEKVHVVTTSYINPQMKALEQKFKDAGLICFNEIGVDPGVDHLWAVKAIHDVHQAGGKIKSFYSYCGGLPEPAVSRFSVLMDPRLTNRPPITLLDTSSLGLLPVSSWHSTTTENSSRTVKSPRSPERI